MERFNTFVRTHPRSSKVLAALASAAILCKVGVSLMRARKAAAFAAEIASLSKNVVHLYTFPRIRTSPSMSYASLKLETFLRISKVPYVVHFTRDTSLSPTERFPMIVYNGTVMAESEFIIQFLTKELRLTTDADLSAEQHAVGLGVRRIIEGDAQFGQYRISIVDHVNVAAAFIAEEFRVPAVAASCMAHLFRKEVIKTLNTVGHGDLTDAQYRSEMLRDHQALETLLSKSAFLFGAKPSSYDCAVYAHVRNAANLKVAGEEPIEFLRNSKILTDFVKRMDAVAFPDLDKITATRFEDRTQDFTKV